MAVLVEIDRFWRPFSGQHGERQSMGGAATLVEAAGEQLEGRRTVRLRVPARAADEGEGSRGCCLV